MIYSKQPLDIPAQIAQLKLRGLNIPDEETAQRFLGNVSYFRLASYLRPMEQDKSTHQFKSNATFENAVSLYHFDTCLREIVFRAIQTIEIALRTKMIHHYSLIHGAFWFLDMSLTENEHLFLENLSAIDREINRSKEEFIKEHFKKYSKPAFPPAWKTFELLSLGTLAKVFFNSKETKIKKRIARDFNHPNHLYLESWLVSITALRNNCAHHARIWNRNYPVTPDLPKRLNLKWIQNRNVPFNKLYPQLCCLAYWMNSIDETNTFASDIKTLLQAYPMVDIHAMGFPDNWEEEPLWQ